MASASGIRKTSVWRSGIVGWQSSVRPLFRIRKMQRIDPRKVAPHVLIKLFLRKFDRVTRNALYRCVCIFRDIRGLWAPQAPRMSMPTDVNIEPSNLCNADCVFCGYQFQKRTHREMPLVLGQEIVRAASQAGAVRIGFTPVVGEPLVHRRLEELIRCATQQVPPLRVGITTNGILLTPTRYRTLIEAGIHSICISMTYPDATEYFRIYRSKGFPKLLANLEGILKIYHPSDCKVTLSIRTPRHSWRTHPLFEHARASGWEVSNNRFFDDWSGRTAAIMEAEGLWRRPNRAKVLPCSILYSGPHFFSDGRATACGCRDLDGKSDLALDSHALVRDMRGIYSNGAVEQIRRRFRQGDVPGICASCRHYTPTFEGEPVSLRLRQIAADAGEMFRHRSP
jgi:hypothetical protein